MQTVGLYGKFYGIHSFLELSVSLQKVSGALLCEMQHAPQDGVQQYSGMLSFTHGSFKFASFSQKPQERVISCLESALIGAQAGAVPSHQDQSFIIPQKVLYVICTDPEILRKSKPVHQAGSKGYNSGS